MKNNHRKIITRFCAAVFILWAAPHFIDAQNDAPKIPAEVQPFVEKGAAAIALESADLNGDGTKDFILVTEKTAPDDDERALLILTRSAAGKLNLAGRNDQVIYCRSCGGVFGDPFAGVEAKRGGFTVNNYGGSNWRWSETYRFNYSRIDKTWQLVLVESESFNALEPNKVKRKIYTPKKFGKINIADFSPESIR